MNGRAWKTFFLALLAGGLLFGCGSSDDSSSTGRLSLSVTDAPVDHAAALYLTIDSVTLQGVEGSTDQGPVAVASDDALVNLMEYTGTGSAGVLSGVEVPAGTYKVRLDVDLTFTAEEQHSWIAFAADAPECTDPLPDGAVWSEDLATCRYPLAIPSGDQSGFKPKGDITIEAGGTSHFTVEFDLRRNVVDPQNAQSIAYVLKPTGLRLVNNAAVGTIGGTIAPEVFPEGCTPTDAKVYLYDRTGAEGTFVADDMYPDNQAFVTSVEVQAATPPETGYHYLIGFVPVGTYAVALTCADDAPEVDDAISFFTEADGITVNAGEESVRSFPAP